MQTHKMYEGVFKSPADVHVTPPDDLDDLLQFGRRSLVGMCPSCYGQQPGIQVPT